MKCPEVVEWMHRYLDYDLSEEETVQLYEHLKQCPECTETFRMLKSLSRDLEDLPKVTPKFSLVDAIMPQLDAIDQARQEKSASREEAPAEMVPVPARPVRNSKFRNSVAGRTAMGAVAAVIILGVAIYNYSPKHLSTAEEPAFTTESKTADTANSASNTVQGSGGEQQDVEPKKDEAVSAGGSSQMESNADIASLDNGEALKAPSDAADKAAKEQPSAPKSEPASKNDVKSNRSADASAGDQTATGASVDSGAPVESSNPAAADQTKTADPGRSQEKIAADGSGSQDTASNPKSSGEAGSSGNEKSLSGNGMASLLAMPTQFISPDGKYTASLDDSKLVIYSVSDKDGQKTAVKTINLSGTWVSGVWSADSTVFTYQTEDDQGTTTSKTYQVNGSDASNP